VARARIVFAQSQSHCDRTDALTIDGASSITKENLQTRTMQLSTRHSRAEMQPQPQDKRLLRGADGKGGRGLHCPFEYLIAPAKVGGRALITPGPPNSAQLLGVRRNTK